MNCLIENFSYRLNFCCHSLSDKRAFAEGLENQTQMPPKQPCSYSFRGLAILSCQVEGKNFGMIRSELEKEKSWSALAVISVSALKHISALAHRNSIVPWLARHLGFAVVTPWFSSHWHIRIKGCWFPYSCRWFQDHKKENNIMFK